MPYDLAGNQSGHGLIDRNEDRGPVDEQRRAGHGLRHQDRHQRKGRPWRLSSSTTNSLTAVTTEHFSYLILRGKVLKKPPYVRR